MLGGLLAKLEKTIEDTNRVKTVPGIRRFLALVVVEGVLNPGMHMRGGQVTVYTAQLWLSPNFSQCLCVGCFFAPSSVRSLKLIFGDFNGFPQNCHGVSIHFDRQSISIIFNLFLSVSITFSQLDSVVQNSGIY